MKLITKILIANRGEIARRIIATCREMGITTVAIYSDADKEAPFVEEADEAIAIGGYQPGESYLDMDKVFDAAKRCGADAIHPGYGFLSENAAFAKRCEKEGVIFIGPRAEAIEKMGDKKTAKGLVQQHNVPVIPGYDGEDQSPENLKAKALEVGFPLLLKASAGGGGKGMRIVREEKHLTKEIEAAKRESKSAFGDDTLLIERYFDSARHIEFQIFGDNHDNAVHLYERECSVQRRYQKIIEESPSPALTGEVRDKMAQAALNVAKAINYNNAGTVEFIVDNDLNFYFLEVNTRLQVEHPVTEAITGLDLVRLQIEVAQGMPLPFQQEDVEISGHAIECRLYAEDPYNNYLPATGRVLHFEPYESDSLRYDSGVESGSLIDIYYDPMIAKVIVHETDRVSALRAMVHGLQNTVLLGTVTNKQFLQDVLLHPQFVEGDFDTRFLEEHPELAEQPPIEPQALHEAAIAATLLRWQHRQDERHLLKNLPSGWRNNFNEPQFDIYKSGEEEFNVQYRYQQGNFEANIGEDNRWQATIDWVEDNTICCTLNGHRQLYTFALAGDKLHVHKAGQPNQVLTMVPRFPQQDAEQVKGGYAAPMPGEVVKVLVQPGDKVKAGDGLVILISMKMENTIEAYEDGEVEEVYVEEKGFVEADELLIKINKS